MRWLGNNVTLEALALYQMGKARNLTEFLNALKYFVVPSQNTVYADIHGVVAYFASGYFPIRDGGYLPFNGSRGEGEWRRLVWLPSVLNYVNPPYLATANNKVADANIYLQWRWADRYRHGGYAYIPDDRHKALLLEMTLMENSIVGMEDRFAKRWLISWRDVEQFASKLIEEYNIVAPGPRAVVKHLSGGNQQKLVVGREFSRNAKLIIAHQPTRGLDVATTEFVHGLIVEARNRGAGVLLVTSDLDEAYKLADTIAVMPRLCIWRPCNTRSS